MSTKSNIENTLGKNKADLILRGGLIANVLTRELLEQDVVVTSGFISYVGKDTDFYQDRNTKILDLNGKIICPDLIESHIHVESSMLSITQFT